MKILFKANLFLLLITPIFLSAQDTITVRGQVVDNENLPLPGVNILVQGTNNGTQTDFDGSYTINNVSPDAVLIFTYIVQKDIRRNVNGLTMINVKMEEDAQALEEVATVGVSASTRNYWVGAKVGYNLLGDSDDNSFVGSAAIEINLLDNLPRRHLFGVIGNLGNFQFTQSEDNKDDIQKLAQSVNGISLGLGYTHESNKIPLTNHYNNPHLYFRQFARMGVRYNSFKDVGEANETVNFAQFVVNGGVELELYGFKNGGALSLSSGVSLYLFDNSLYEQLFEEEKSSLLTVDVTLTLPLSKSLGLFTNGTFARNSSPIFVLGLVVKPDLDEKKENDS